MEFKNGPAAAQSLVSQLPEGTRQVLVYAIDLRNAIYFYAKDIQFKKVPATSRELHEPNWVVMEEKSFPSFKANVSSFKERGRLFYEGHKMVIVETGLDNLNEDSP